MLLGLSLLKNHLTKDGADTAMQLLISLSNMGRQALISHMQGAKHVRNTSATSATSEPSITSFVNQPPASSIPEQTDVPFSVDATAVPTSDITVFSTLPEGATVGNVPSDNIPVNKRPKSAYYITEQITKAEILWAMKTIHSHYSYNSCCNVTDIFSAMFPDSNIARSMSVGSTKIAYMVTYGTAPYFQSQLAKSTESCTEYVVCFDEALNKVIQRGQMDIVVRFWDNDLKQVSSRYLNSVFLGHSRATDLLTKFNEGLVSLPTANLLQVSMDGPSVNWKFLETLKDSRHQHQQDRQLLELGSCGLHVIHGALQSGHSAAGWNVNSVLRAMCNVFKDSPARRSDYIHITGSTKFPKKFCQVRWVENTTVRQMPGNTLKLSGKIREKSQNFILPNLWEP